MEKLIWHNERRKINDLIPTENNPRQMTEKQAKDLENSLKKFDLVDIPAINTDNRIISGHQRLKILQLLGRGQEEIDVRVPNRTLTKEEHQEYMLRANKNLAEWNYGLLADFQEDFLKDIGFENEELDQIFGLEMAEEFDEKKEFEKAVKNPRGVKTGDVWEIGEHRLIIGDCADRKNWEKLLGRERFDFCFTDPPYRLAYCRKRVRKVKTKEGFKTKREREYNVVGETDYKGKLKGFGAKLNRTYQGIIQRGVLEYEEWLSIANDFQNPNGANVMVFENWRNVVELWQAIEKYWKIKNIVIWHLPNRHQGFAAKGKLFNKYDIAPLAGEGIINEQFEEEFQNYLEDKGQKLLDTYQIILYSSKGKNSWNKIKGKRYWTLSDHIDWVASSAVSTNQSIIFGTKPIQILVPYIKILSPRNGIIMEPFAGSGSTIIASEIMKRKCRAIEIGPIYGEVILTRIERFMEKKAVKLN